MELSTYLLFSGNCEEAFKFYEKTLGGKIEMMMPHEGSPAEANVPPEWRKKILHARMTVGNNVLMASDAPPAYAPKQLEGFSVSLMLNDPVEAERIFRALEEKGKVQMPFQQTFWALRFGMVTDRFGVPWMINCEKAA
jgi:PhnB protein